jgi:hypothetical protein
MRPAKIVGGNDQECDAETGYKCPEEKRIFLGHAQGGQGAVLGAFHPAVPVDFQQLVENSGTPRDQSGADEHVEQ